jgi:hypothetical protein
MVQHLRRVGLRASLPLNQLQSVSERILDIGMHETVACVILGKGVARRPEDLDQAVQIADEEAGVSLPCRSKLRIDAQVDPDARAFEPRSPPSSKMRRLLDLRQAQEVDVEAPRRLFLPRRHGQLHVIDPHDLQVPLLRPSISASYAFEPADDDRRSELSRLQPALPERPHRQHCRTEDRRIREYRVGVSRSVVQQACVRRSRLQRPAGELPERLVPDEASDGNHEPCKTGRRPPRPAS